MPSEFYTIVGVVIGFGLAELSQLLKSQIGKRKLRSALDAELKAIARTIPSKTDVLEQAFEKISGGHFMPTTSTHFPNYVFNQIMEKDPNLITNMERDCLHMAYERLRVIDLSMDNMEHRFSLITESHSSLHASEAIGMAILDMKNSLPVTKELIESVLNKKPIDVFGDSDGT